jgi:hypothetical protein
MLEVLTGLDAGRGTWLLTSTRSPVTVPFYRRCGWLQVTDLDDADHSEEQLVVFLSPHHPRRSQAAARKSGVRGR